MQTETTNDAAARIRKLEAFARVVCDVADTLQVLGRAWGGAEGEGLTSYAKQLGEAAREVLELAE